VAEAADGAEALRATAVTQPDLVLLDLEMPGVNGLTALPALRAAHPDAAVVAVSAAGHLREAALRAGAAGFVDKSHLVQELPGVLGALPRP